MKEPKKSRLIWGIALAALGLFGLPGVRNTETPVTYLITCLLLMAGGALLIIFYIRALKAYKRKILDALKTRKRMQTNSDVLTRQEEEAEEQRRIQMANALRICPCCGAATKGYVCEYCGSKI